MLDNDDPAIGDPLVDWPFTAVENNDPDAVDWSRNAPGRTLEQMINLNLNLYLHESDAGIVLGVSERADWSCQWHNLSALNDEIQAALAQMPEGTEPIHTGLILGTWVPMPETPDGPDEDEEPDAPPTADWFWYNEPEETQALHACRYRDAIVRARQEAADHPQIHKLVIFDELHRLVRSPDNYWSVAKWSGEAVSVLSALAQETDGGQRAACNAALDARWNGGVDSELAVFAGYDPATALSPAAEAPVELWARISAAAVPRIIVPSVTIGVMGRPVGGPTISGADHRMEPGESVRAEWVVWTKPSDPRLNWDNVQISVDLLANLNTPDDSNDAKLVVSINGIDQPALTLRQGSPGRRSIQYSAAVVRRPFMPHAIWPWEVEELVPNRVQVRVERVESVESVESVDEPEPTTQITATVFGARVTFKELDPVDQTTVHKVYEYTLDPEDAVFTVTGTPGMVTPAAVPCGDGDGSDTPAICTDNSEYLISPDLDGVSIAHDINFEWAGQPTISGMPYSVAWSRFIEYTCDTIHKRPGSPARCLVDERHYLAEVDELDLLNYDEAVFRIDTGRTRGDGEVNTFLAVELADAGYSYGTTAGAGPMLTPGGRFDDRPPYWDYRDLNGGTGGRYTSVEFARSHRLLNYLPRHTKPHPGERQTWTFAWDRALNPACNAEWELGYHIHASLATPTYGPVLERHEVGEEAFEFAIELEDQADPYMPGTARALTTLEPTDVHQTLPGTYWIGSYVHTRRVLDATATPPLTEPRTAVAWVYDASETDIDALRVGWEVKPNPGDPELGDQRASLSWFVLPPPGCVPSRTAPEISVHPLVEGWYQKLTCYLIEGDVGGCGMAAHPSAPPSPPSLPW
ncbi:MAG: hypothetical protein JNM72_08190 [Deltaproteobacteria bacterium]|nr:hypothetical protein [Deltaproteobacteria bacterium]